MFSTLCNYCGLKAKDGSRCRNKYPRQFVVLVLAFFIVFVCFFYYQKLQPLKFSQYPDRNSVNKPFKCERRRHYQGAPSGWSSQSIKGENGLIVKPDFTVAPFENPIPPLFADGTPVHAHWFNSQYDEDKLLISRFLCDKENGVFVELGATDGTWLSNSRVFHEYRNWTGVLIEPYPALFNKLIQSWRCRMGAFCLPMAVCNELKVVEFLGEDAMAGIVATHLQRNHFQNMRMPRYRVPCAPMKDILKMTGIRNIDLFSIDVEGAEIGIIESMDWSIPVHVILMEQDAEGNESTKRINSILTEQGFEFYGRVGSLPINVLYVHPDYHARVAKLEKI